VREQAAVARQEFEMESSRMARETQILQDEVDEMKARTRALQEEGERKVRDKDRYIQVLWKAMEVHGIVGPFVPAPTSGQVEVVEGTVDPWSNPTALRKALDSLLRDRQRAGTTGGGSGGAQLLDAHDFGLAVPKACGLPPFFGRRLHAHALSSVSGHGELPDKKAISVEAFVKYWSERLYPLATGQQFFRLLTHADSRTEAITTSSLQPLIADALESNPQLLLAGLASADRGARARVSTVLAQRIMHFCCRTSVRRMSRLDYDSSDLGEVLQALAQGGDLAPMEKVTAFFATEEADQVVRCFDKMDSDHDQLLTVADLLASRNGGDGGTEDEMGLVPRCGTFTLSQAAIEGVFSSSSTSADQMDLTSFARLFHAYVYPHAPSATRFWFDVVDLDKDGRINVADFQRLLQEQVFILNTHLESQGEQPCFATENLMEQVLDMLGPSRGLMQNGGYAGGGWCCSDVVASRTGLVFFDVMFNYEALLRYERQSVATGGQPYIAVGTQ
jgi:hypothetical protein